MHTFATFEAKIFNPFLPESKQVNDGVYGAELAWWLCKKLATKNIYTSYPEFEDYTWFISYQHDDQELEIHCHNQFSKPNLWEIEIKTYPSGRFKIKPTPMNDFSELFQAIQKTLQDCNNLTNLIVHPPC